MIDEIVAIGSDGERWVRGITAVAGAGDVSANWWHTSRTWRCRGCFEGPGV